MSSLPPNWANSTLGKLAGTGQYGWTTKASDQGKVKFLRTTDITKGQIDWQRVPFCSEAPSDVDKYSLSVGDILISRAGSVGFSSLLTEVPETAVFASYLIRYMPNMDIVAPCYLAHYLKSQEYWNQIADVSAGVALANVNATKLAALTLPLAPLNEQKRIADKLDAVLARVDACRDRLGRIPAILKRFRQSVLAAATSGKLTADWRIANATAKEWTYHPLGDLCSRVSVGHVGETSKYYTTADDGIPFLRSQNVRPGRVALEGLTYITREFHSKLKKSQLFPGDLLVVRVGANRGDSCILPDGFSEINCANIVFARPQNVLPAYLSIFFQSPSCQEDLLGKSVGGAQGVINTKVVEQIIVSLPPDIEQAEIVRRVEALFACADRLEARYAAARAQVEKLTPATLAKAFRGELVPQDPNDEPASVLLGRIKAKHGEKVLTKPKRGRKVAA